jgi:hypothetical protein
VRRQRPRRGILVAGVIKVRREGAVPAPGHRVVEGDRLAAAISRSPHLHGVQPTRRTQYKVSRKRKMVCVVAEGDDMNKRTYIGTTTPHITKMKKSNKKTISTHIFQQQFLYENYSYI